PAGELIDLANKYVIPGLIDINMHIESSMTTPTAFGAQVAQFGTTTIVADDHEIANVAGISGLKEFMKQPSLIDVFYAIPSSVPSTNSDMETTGGIIDEKATAELLKNPRVIALGEAMNFHGLVAEPQSLISKLVNLCRQQRPTMPLEGHCPKYTGEDLASFINAGITSDHTHQTPSGMLERIANRMFIELQNKSLTPEIIQTVIDHNLYEHVAFVTDDVMADDLCYGHLNKLLEKAINYGLDPAMA
ncbi:adenosine deaminase, partial [Lactobacillus sp. XV13L]|nr:adenosine deaminase [Lactobacillus sp. XV13L]